MSFGAGTLSVTADTALLADGGSTVAARLLASWLPATSGPPRRTDPLRSPAPPGSITLITDAARRDLGDEGYALSVTPNGATITGAAPRGVLWGTQTLRQLAALPTPPGAIAAETDARIELPVVDIVDQPRFPWRGLLLDVGRNFFPVPVVERLIDVMALYKYNTFHWHLTDDQGWRIEVRSRPRLTGVGARRTATPLPHDPTRSDGTPCAGHYTQEDVRRVVAYAAERGVTVVPEIEMPGHSQAALASYPELGCAGSGYQVATTWGVKNDVLCAGRETTFAFLEEVLDEVLELFPGTFIHVGGDECPKKAWRCCRDCRQRITDQRLADEDELQSWFIRRIAGWLADRGRRLVGWDEILEGGLAPGATVMSWRGSDGGVTAATAGHDVVMSPNTHCYFDYYQSQDTAAEPPAIGGHLPLEQVHSFEPVPPELAGHAHHVLGVQGNIWTEYIATEPHVQYMALPRALALAEVAWTPAQERSLADFRGRLDAHRPLLDRLGVNYRPWRG